MWHAQDGMGWWMIFGSLMMIAFWGGVIWLIVSLARPSRPEPPGQDTAIRILRERYARGELSREEFDRMLAELNGTSR